MSQLFSIVFGMLTSTVLIMLVLPAMYAIMDDIGFLKLTGESRHSGSEQVVD